MTTKVYLTQQQFSRSLDVHIIAENSGKRFVAQPLVLHPLDDGVINEPALYLKYEDAQFLMDQLWNCGLRPSEGTGSAGALAATQAHLKDLRELVFSVITPGLLDYLKREKANETE